MSEAVCMEAVGLWESKEKGNDSKLFRSVLKNWWFVPIVAPIAEPEKMKPLLSSVVLSLECSALSVLAEAPCVWGSVENVEIWLGLFVLPG